MDEHGALQKERFEKIVRRWRDGYILDEELWQENVEIMAAFFGRAS